MTPASTRCVRALLTALVAITLTSCSTETERPRNVLLVSIDTLRADRVGCYGRADAGTPTLDALAARGTRFADAMAPSPTTAATHASLFTGLLPLRHGVRHNGMFALSSPSVTLAERLSDAGLRTAGFVGSIVLAERFGFAQGFESYGSPRQSETRGLFYLAERSALEVNRDALDWLDGIAADPFFLFVHYMEPHAPYDPPEPERSRFDNDRYQGEIAAADRALGELLSALASRGRLEETLVLVLADHGESLGEHGELTHGIFLYQSTLHVPLLVAGPGVPDGRTISTPVSLVDVAPTVLEAVGLPPATDGDGRSLWESATEERALYAESFVPRYDHGWSELRALRREGFKYILAPRAELYSLTRDPTETNNLLDEQAEQAASMAGELAAWVDRDEGRSHAAQALSVTPAEREALEALGYLSGAKEPTADAELADPKERIDETIALGRADELIRVGRPAEGVRLLRELVAANPDSLDTRTRLLLALILQGRTDAAVEEGRELFDAARRVPNGIRKAARAHLLLGQMYLDLGRPEDAVTQFERAFEAPQPSEVYDMLAALHHDLGRDDEAIRVLHESVERGLDSERTRTMLRLLEPEAR